MAMSVLTVNDDRQLGGRPIGGQFQTLAETKTATKHTKETERYYEER